MRAERIQAAEAAVHFVKSIVCVKTCQKCEKSFTVKRYNTRKRKCDECVAAEKKQFHSIMCVDNCVFCGEEFLKDRGHSAQRKCSKKCEAAVAAHEKAAAAYAFRNDAPVQVEPDVVTLKPERNIFRKTTIVNCSVCGAKSASSVCENCNEEHVTSNYMTFEKKGFVERKTVINLRKVHEKDKKEGIFDFRCPNPSKKVYRTEDEANAFISLVHSDDQFIHPYVCRCGAIHIGH